MALNRTTDNSSRTSQTKQRSQPLETNNIHQTENVLLFRNFFNDINDYFYIFFIFFENIMFLFLVTRNEIKRIVNIFLNKQEKKESLETKVVEIEVNHSDTVINSPIKVEHRNKHRSIPNVEAIKEIEISNSSKQKCSCKGSCDKKNCSCFKLGLDCNENCHNGDHKNCLNIFC